MNRRRFIKGLAAVPVGVAGVVALGSLPNGEASSVTDATGWTTSTLKWRTPHPSSYAANFTFEGNGSVLIDHAWYMHEPDRKGL